MVTSPPDRPDDEPVKPDQPDQPTRPEEFPSPDEYGRSLPGFSANLLVRDPRASAGFYRAVFGATVRHIDPEFAALVVNGTPLMLHADPTYAGHPWAAELRGGVRRGLGAELRVLGLDPDLVARVAEENGGTVLQPAQDKPHGWRETIVADPDGYTWAVGRRLE